MPGGLNEVVQPFGADASQYKSELSSVLPIIREVNAAQKEFLGNAAQMAALRGQASGAGLGGGAADIAKTNASIRETLATLREYQTTVSQTARVVSDASAGYETMRASIAEVGDAVDSHATSLQQFVRVQDAATDAVADHAVALDRASDASSGGAESVAAYATNLAALRDTARDTKSALADVAVATAAMSSGGGSSAPAMSLTEIGRMMDQSASAAGFASYRAAAAAAGLGPGGGGGGGGGGSRNANYDAMNSWGPQGGDGGSRGFGPFNLSGSAGSQADSVIAFARTWLPRLHWAMMATNEVLATVGPAAVAVGSAALVGLEGGQQLVNRYNAIDATAESLGPAFGQTTGSFMGAGSALQRYQTMADGGVYELAGAGINIARTGGGVYGQMGLNTIAMLDRGVADMQVNMQQRGTNAQVASILGGGTDYLKTFGDIGANVGNIFLGLAPHLPGLGGDYLATLSGATGGAASLIQLLNRNHLGDVLGGGLALEAGGRVGTPLVGLVGKLLQSGGLKLAGLGGDSFLGEAGLGIGSLGEGLTALGGPEVAGLALSAFLGSKLYSSMPGSAERQMGALQQSVYGNGGFSSAFTPLGRAITTATGLGASAAQTMQSREGIGATETYGELGRFGPMGQTTAGIYQQAATGFSKTMGDLIDSGPQLQQALQKAGLKGVSMADAFQIAQNSLLDLSHAFNSHGQLTQQAKQMMTNYVSAIGPMTQNAGAFGAAVAGQTIMGTEAMQDVAKVNSAMDSMTQIMTGTALGASGLGASTAALTPAVAKGLGSVTSPGSAAAWNAFASASTTAPGIITQLQSFNDQMRTNLTLGSSTSRQAQGMTGYEIQQSVQTLGPGLKRDPAALAMLMQQAAQQGIGGYYQGGAGDAAKNYAALEKSLKGTADSAKQMNADSTAATIKNSQLPTLAKQFVQGTAADVQSQQIAKAAQDAMNIKGGVNVKANTADLISQLRAAGVQGGSALKQSLDAVLQQAGVSKAMRIKIEADASQALGVISQLKADQIHNKKFEISANNAPAIAAVAQAVAAAEGMPNVTRTITYIVRMIGTVTGTPGGVPLTPAGIAASAPALYTKRMSTGGMVPGFGSGDHVPALLEPGEAIVPRYLVPLIAPILKSHHVPGFAAGGIVPAGTLAGVNSQISAEWKILDALYAKADSGDKSVRAQIDNIWKTILDPLYKAKDAFHDVSKSAASTAASTKTATTAASTLATSIANKFATAMNYARGVSGAASAGQGFGTAGLLSGMDPTQKPVAQQMQDYLTSEQGFTKDIKALTKGGLNKNLISQLVAAGPVQGDLLAQSILMGGGTSGPNAGIGQVNSLWKQIGAQSHILGATAANSIYGSSIAPNLKSGTTTNNISINVNVPSGSGANLALTTAQIKLIVEAVQAALLKQAKRNRATGIKLPIKSA